MLYMTITGYKQKPQPSSWASVRPMVVMRNVKRVPARPASSALQRDAYNACAWLVLGKFNTVLLIKLNYLW